MVYKVEKTDKNEYLVNHVVKVRFENNSQSHKINKVTYSNNILTKNEANELAKELKHELFF